MAWREDNRREANGTQFAMVIDAALASGVSRQWKGCWQRLRNRNYFTTHPGNNEPCSRTAIRSRRERCPSITASRAAHISADARSIEARSDAVSRRLSEQKLPFWLCKASDAMAKFLYEQSINGSA